MAIDCQTFYTRCLLLASATLLLWASPSPVLFFCPQISLAQTPTVRATKKSEAEQLYQAATEQLNKSQFRAALKAFEQVLATLRQISEPQAEAATLNQIGLVYNNLGESQKALNYYQQALTIFQQQKARKEQGTALTNIAAVYRNLGQYQKALEFYQQALTLRREVKDAVGEAATLNNMAAVYDNLGQYQKSLEFYQQALAIFEKVNDGRGKGTTLNNIGLNYGNQGAYPEALSYYKQALEILEAAGDRMGVGRTLTNIGFAYSNLAEYPKALVSLEQALAIRREIGDRPGEAVTLDRMGTVHRQQNSYQTALQFYEQALTVFREVNNTSGEGYTLSNIGATLLKSGSFEEATKKLMAAVEVWESLRPGLTDENKVSLFERQAETYSFLQQALIAQNKTEAALEIAERGRARAFAELLASRLGTEKSEQLAASKPPNLAQIKRIAAEQKATLIEYSIVDEKVYVWAIAPGGDIAFRQIDTSNLNISLSEAAKNTLVAAATGRNRGGAPDARAAESGNNSAKVSARRINRHLHETYKLLIEPIANILPKNEGERVIFIPQGVLFLIPFAALQDAAGNYIIEKHTISIAPSIQVLDLTRQHRQRLRSHPNSQVLVVGNPTMPSIRSIPDEAPTPLSPLPGAEKEAIAIASILGTQAVVGKDATERAIAQKMSQARIIHLATHGLLNELQDRNLGVPGAIALAPDRTPPTGAGTGAPPLHQGDAAGDGLLTSGEIFHLKLNAELVVLSACNTGRGTISGDGVLGLSRSFISAGVSSIVVSLWFVPDAPTADLMTEFYRQLQQNSDKAAALRQAMLATMRLNPQPSNWAAFTLIGEAD
ncbi:CHAT domain-containing tetratricopeptide repeat protein [Microcoleus sp. MOSTC5]|uniref:CHAT domain-containing tetratricopeptide repeat protein n=1 Tax=Microcoleus sp. MOSTC5 TaxID=3055378 RepID=UPI002FCF8006